MKRVLFIEFDEVDTPPFYSYHRFDRWVDIIAEHYGKRVGKLSFVYCDDAKILNVNNEFLNHDYYTDIITFDYCRRDILNGDIYISIDTVKSNSELFGTTFEDEFNRVFCHGILHLIGFKDKTDEDSIIMREQEAKCLQMLNLVGV